MNNIELTKHLISKNYKAEDIEFALYETTLADQINLADSMLNKKKLLTDNSLINSTVIPYMGSSFLVYNTNVSALHINGSDNIIIYDIIIEHLLGHFRDKEYRFDTQDVKNNDIPKIYIFNHSFFDRIHFIKKIHLYIKRNSILSSINHSNTNTFLEFINRTILSEKLAVVQYTTIDDFKYKFYYVKNSLNVGELIVIDSLKLFNSKMNFTFEVDAITNTFITDIKAIKSRKSLQSNSEIKQKYHKYSEAAFFNKLFFSLVNESNVSFIFIDRFIKKTNKYGKSFTVSLTYKDMEYTFNFNPNDIKHNSIVIIEAENDQKEKEEKDQYDHITIPLNKYLDNIYNESLEQEYDKPKLYINLTTFNKEKFIQLSYVIINQINEVHIIKTEHIKFSSKN